jgi:hypothetical protein
MDFIGELEICQKKDVKVAIVINQQCVSQQIQTILTSMLDYKKNIRVLCFKKIYLIESGYFDLVILDMETSIDNEHFLRWSKILSKDGFLLIRTSNFVQKKGLLPITVIREIETTLQCDLPFKGILYKKTNE